MTLVLTLLRLLRVLSSSVGSGTGRGTFVEGTTSAAASSDAGSMDVVAVAAAVGAFSVAASAGYGGWGKVLVAWR